MTINQKTLSDIMSTLNCTKEVATRLYNETSGNLERAIENYFNSPGKY
jgi:hypothetical protein